MLNGTAKYMVRCIVMLISHVRVNRSSCLSYRYWLISPWSCNKKKRRRSTLIGVQWMIKQKGYLSLPPFLLISLPCLCHAFWLQSSHIIYRRPLFKRHLPPASRHHSASLKLSSPCLILTGGYHKSVFSLWFICSFIVLPAASYAGTKITWWVWVQRTSSELEQVPHLCLFDSTHQFLQFDFGWQWNMYLDLLPK